MGKLAIPINLTSDLIAVTKRLADAVLLDVSGCGEGSRTIEPQIYQKIGRIYSNFYPGADINRIDFYRCQNEMFGDSSMPPKRPAS